MADLSDSTRPDADDTRGQGSQSLESAVEELTTVLLAVARGDFSQRAARDFSGAPLDVLAYLVNSTAEEVGALVAQLEAERQELQVTRDRLVQAAKLAALGELATGVAHELNQPLTAMSMLVDLLRLRRVGSAKQRARDLELMAEAVRRMGRTVDSVRLFGRVGATRRVAVLADEPMKNALALMTESLRGIEVEQRYASSLPTLHADADRLHQVFVNLLTNARDALRDIDSAAPRRIVVEVEASEDCAVYRVEDTGPGVPAEIVPRIFDPFFTTKQVGRGTGLGLALSHAIVLEHGGTMRYEAVDGGGARFVVELPNSAVD